MSRNDEYIIEFYKIGHSVKVSALDPVSLKEVSIVGDAKMPNGELAKIAVRKLKYVLRRDEDIS